MIELRAREWTSRTGTGNIAIVDLQAQVDESLTKEQLLGQVVLIDGAPYAVDNLEWSGGSAVLGLIVRPVPASPATGPIPYQTLRQPFVDLVDDCLDLLDQLVDPLPETTVMKSRVQTWKKMMRDLVGDYRKDGSGE